MKLQRVVNRKTADRTYYKWKLQLPPDLVEAVGWEPGDEIEATRTEDGRVILRNLKDER